MINRLFRRKPITAPVENGAGVNPAPYLQYTPRRRFGDRVSSSFDERGKTIPKGTHALPFVADDDPAWRSAGSLTNILPTEHGLVAQYENARLRIEWVAPDCIRVLREDDQDGALTELSVLLPPVHQPHVPPNLERSESDADYRMSSGAAECRLDKRLGTLSMWIADGEEVYRELLTPMWRGDDATRFSLRLRPDSMCSGFGARHGALNVSGERFSLYASSAHGVIAPVPFALLTMPKASCGIYWRSVARAHVDAGATRPGELNLQIDDPHVDYLVIVSHSPIGVLARLSSILPSAPLPPLWGLGAHFSGDGFLSAEQTAALVLDFHLHEMPCTAVHLGATVMDGARPLTVNAERFPSLHELVNALHAEGMQVVLETPPGIQPDLSYPIYTSGQSRNAFLRHADGNVCRAMTMSGECVFPDFIRDDVRSWWSEQLRPLVRSGIDGFGIYHCGPDIVSSAGGDALPDEVTHHLGSSTVLHPRVRAAYSARMAEAAYTALERDRPALRPYLRLASGATDAAQQGFLTIEMSGGWGGLSAGLRAVLNAAISGISLPGLEIDADDGEMLVRAFQAACLMPSLIGWVRGGGDGLPWNYSAEVEHACRETLLLRSRLLPYLYSCIALSREYGVPVIRPMWMQDPGAHAAVDDAFMLGDHILIAPVLTVGMRERSVMLPEGLWYDYWTNRSLVGGKRHSVAAPLERVPVFVRGGAALPLAPALSGRSAGIPIVRIYPGNGESTTFDDAGEGFSYLHGDYRWVYYTCNWETNVLFILNRRRAGGFFPSEKRLSIEIVGLGEAPDEVRLDRHGAPLWFFDDGVVEIAADDEAGRIEVWLEGSPTSPTRKRKPL